MTHGGEAHHEVPILVMLLPTLAMAAGFAVAWYFYIRNPLVPFGLAKRFRGAHQFLLHAWYFDDLYDFLFVRPGEAYRALPVEDRRRHHHRRHRA